MYGRLYEWKAAIAGCKALGEDWRLPTDEEWKKLAMYFGGYNQPPGQEGKPVGDSEKAFNEMTQGMGDSHINVLLGGWRTDRIGNYNQLGYSGHYWSSTEQSLTNAWYFGFDKIYGVVYRNTFEKLMSFSCRCVKD